MLLDYLVAILLGIVTSVEDIKHRKIRNKYLTAVLLYIFFADSIQYYFFGGYNYFFSVFINSLCSLIFSFLIWRYGLWTAADGKLFFIYSALLPLGIYKLGYVRYFPSFSLFLNTVLPLAIFFVVRLLQSTDRAEKIEVLTNTFKPNLMFGSLVNGALMFISFSWIFGALLAGFFSGANNVLLVLAVILVMNFAVSRLGRYCTPIFFISTVVGFIFYSKLILNLSFARNLVFVLFLFLLVPSFLNNLAFFMFNQRVRVPELSPGMIPLEMAVRHKNEIKLVLPQALAGLNKAKLLYSQKEGGLSKKDIDMLRRLHSKGKLSFDGINIQQTLPFAPFMFFGVVLTLLAEGDLVSVIKLYLYKL